MAREQSNFPGLKDPRKQSALGRMADRDVLRAQKAAAWQALTDPQPQPEMTKIPSAKEFALNSRVAEANREEKPTGALALILRELPRFFKADDELADAMGDFSLRQGATATGGTILGLAAPAYLPLRTALARAATGVPLSVAGGWVMDPAAEKIFGSSVSDPLSDAVFGAMAGASGKIVTPMLSAIATSSGDAEAALGKVLRYAASKSDGNLTRPFKVHKTPFAAEAEFNLPGATRIRRTPEPLTESEGKAYEGMSVVPLLMDSGAERSVLRGDAINRITGERFAKGGLARIAARMGSDAAPARRGVSNVIKEKGGNWLTGSVEEALGGLKKLGTHSPEDWAKAEDILRRSAAGAISGVDTAASIRNLNDFLSKRALDTFIDKQLTRYIKNEMATPEDPIRALAERGVLHFEPRGIRDRAPIMDKVAARRLASGNPAQERAVTPLGEQWERYADAAIAPDTAFQQRAHAGTLGKNPWLEKVAPDTPVYSVDYQQLGGPMAQESLGFPHLIDELSNAMNPESGLPRHLQLDPKSIDRVSVPQAVERVAEINKWRAAQRAEADAMRANNAATVLHKEYPENNPLGLRWVELRQPEGLPEGFKVEPVAQGFDLIDDKGNRLYAGREMTDAVRIAHGTQRARGINPLGDALKYEGDTMGHCVGGYCDDVVSGRSRIYSLRDAKGQPHVTIETAPERTRNADEWYAWQKANPEEYAKLNTEFGEDMDAKLKAAAERYKVAPSIKQIKGKQNRAPNPEYLPFVQDFVKSGKWSDVGDLFNTGLVQHPSGYLTKDELGKLVDEGDLDAIRLWQQSYIAR